MGFIQNQSTPNVGNYSGSGGLLSFLGNLVSGVHGVNQERAAEKQTATENALHNRQLELGNKQTDLQMTELQNKIETTKQQDAMSKYSSISQIMLTNPSYASDPSIIDAWNKNANAAGLPAPRNKDGTPNLDALKPQFNSIDTSEQLRIMETAPGVQRDALLAKYGNVPQAMRTAPQYLPWQEKVAEGKLAQVGIHYAHEDEARAAGVKIRSRATDIRAQLAAGTLKHMTAEDQSLLASANLNNTRASAIPQQLSISQGRLELEAKRTQAYVQSVQQRGDKSSLSQLATANRSLEGAISTAQRNYDDAVKNYATAEANGADETTLGSASDAILQAKNQLSDVQTIQSQATSLLSSTASYGQNLASQTGNPVNVTKPGGGKTFNSTDGYVWTEVSPGQWKSTGKKWKK